jgi:hypothetical protein
MKWGYILEVIILARAGPLQFPRLPRQGLDKCGVDHRGWFDQTTYSKNAGKIIPRERPLYLAGEGVGEERLYVQMGEKDIPFKEAGLT